MKTFLITTVLSIATTTAFGAASLRTPQLGGGTTGATASTPTTARAGTMRAQTMKTSSISMPASATTTQSTTTPVSTETTDARIALLKGIKGFNPGKIKDTTAAQQELNAIDSRIEELQTQLDRAEATQSTVLTEDTIDAKIEQKLNALGTSTGTKETYSKAEVDALLSNIVKKLPTLDDRGNMTWTDPNGNLIALLPYYVSSDYPYGGSLGQITEYTLHTPHDFGTTNWYPNLAQEYTSGWIGNICAPYQSDPDLLACGFWTANGTSTAIKDFYVARCFKGFFLAGMNHPNGIESDKYFTYENMTQEEIYEHFCGDAPDYSCWISDFEIKPRGPCKLRIFYVNTSNYYFNYLGADIDGYGLGHLEKYITDAPANSPAIDNFVSEYCGDRTPFWCSKHAVVELSSGQRMIEINERLHGYAPFGSPDPSSLGIYTEYATNENNPSTYINNEICGNPNGTDSCYVVNVLDFAVNNPGFLDPESFMGYWTRYLVRVFSAFRQEDQLPTPYAAD